MASHFAKAFGQPFVPENRPGAGGTIGTDAVAKATDGHTIGISINAPLSTAKALYPSIAYDPQKDLAPVSLLVRGAQILVTHPSVPADDLQGFLAHVKGNPGKLTYGSVGRGRARTWRWWTSWPAPGSRWSTRPTAASRRPCWTSSPAGSRRCSSSPPASCRRCRPGRRAPWR